MSASSPRNPTGLPSNARCLSAGTQACLSGTVVRNSELEPGRRKMEDLAGTDPWATHHYDSQAGLGPPCRAGSPARKGRRRRLPLSLYLELETTLGILHRRSASCLQSLQSLQSSIKLKKAGHSKIPTHFKKKNKPHFRDKAMRVKMLAESGTAPETKPTGLFFICCERSH